MNKHIIVLVSIIYLTPNIAFAKFPLLYENPKFGMEMSHRILKWEEGMGKDHFAESFPQIDFFVEFPIFEQFSLKIGHEETMKKKNLVDYGDTSNILTVENPAGLNTTYSTFTKLTGNYIDAIYNYTIFKHNNYKIQLIAFLGIATSKLKLSQRDISYANYQGYENLTTNKKSYLRQGIGIQSIFNNGIGFKIGVTHEKISKLKSILLTSHGGNNYRYLAEARNSIIFNIGISYQL